ncbi:WXG100 family type VII secretion target [Streptomyces sp. bgisy100]|uniref:WXG100 family type VII secretion target n=1 Tax=Streptomyces sp. bgisy100 TaxID=3413783 RepID=UPI003D733992
MSPRPHDWEPLHDGDPIPGDPHEVARLGKRLRRMADEIDKQADNIKALSSVESWDSDAGRGFHEIADGTAARLKRAYDRYDEAAKALGTKVVQGESNEYASELNRAQKVADKALDEFREAEREQKHAGADLEKFHGTVPSADDATERTRLEKKRDAAMDVIRRCHSEVGRAKIIRDDAAKAAAKHIRNTVHHDGVRDQGGIMNFLADWADRFANLSAIFSILAVICVFVPPLEVLAPIFGALAVLTSAAALVGHSYDMSARGGELNGWKLFFDGLGVMPGLGSLKGFRAVKGLSGLSKLRGIRFSGSDALAGVSHKFFNGLAVTVVNGVLVKSGRPAITGERITAGIKTGSFVGALVKIFGGHNGERTGDPGDPPKPTPAAPSPRPSPQPKPSPQAFHTALAH